MAIERVPRIGPDTESKDLGAINRTPSFTVITVPEESKCVIGGESHLIRSSRT